MKSNNSIKLTRSNLFRIQFIEKNNWGGSNEKKFERNWYSPSRPRIP